MHAETIELHGHILDSLTLPKVLDDILSLGGDYDIGEVRVGHRRSDPSYARIRVQAPDRDTLDQILLRLRQHGAEPVDEGDVTLAAAPANGVYPAGFYVTTNHQTAIRHRGQWIDVHPSRMDGGIVFDPRTGQATVKKFPDVQEGDLVVIGSQGVRAMPLERSTEERNAFEFMASAVSSEKPKSAVIRAVAEQMRAVKAVGEKILVVAGPAVVHTGAGRHMVRLIEAGYIDVLFSGNALAVHDVEEALFGTALGVYLNEGTPSPEGHEHHIRAINAIRAEGGLARAVESGLLTSGLMHACVRHGVEMVLAGSIRDDGPLPEVITDVIQAQRRMAQAIEGVSLAIMIASMLHSIAVGNLLPAVVKTVCVDINPAVVTKLADRGTWQAVGLVTDVEPFFVELLGHLGLPRD
jgi:lysine-ketoglutarate reductase/saccharopine dehydrogenase-like protein (TIGR00300 family)